LQISACPFFLFILAIVLSVFIRFTVSDYSFGMCSSSYKTGDTEENIVHVTSNMNSLKITKKQSAERKSKNRQYNDEMKKTLYKTKGTINWIFQGISHH
jgi:choline-glycine betaine transporter